MDFKVLKNVAVIDTKGSWNLELNWVQVDENEPKLDVRSWNTDHTKMSKGICLTLEQFNSLKDIDVKPYKKAATTKKKTVVTANKKSSKTVVKKAVKK